MSEIQAMPKDYRPEGCGCSESETYLKFLIVAWWPCTGLNGATIRVYSIALQFLIVTNNDQSG